MGRRRISTRELERRLLRRLHNESCNDVELVVYRLRRYAVARRFAAYCQFERLEQTMSAVALTPDQIQQSIRERLNVRE